MQENIGHHALLKRGDIEGLRKWPRQKGKWSAEAGRWPYIGSGQPGGPTSPQGTSVLRPERIRLGLESGGKQGWKERS